MAAKQCTATCGQNMNIWLSLHKKQTHTHISVLVHTQAPCSMHQLSCRCANWLDVVLKIVSVQSPACLRKRSCPFNSASQQAVNRKRLWMKRQGSFKVYFPALNRTVLYDPYHGY